MKQKLNCGQNVAVWVLDTIWMLFGTLGIRATQLLRAIHGESVASLVLAISYHQSYRMIVIQGGLKLDTVITKASFC